MALEPSTDMDAYLASNVGRNQGLKTSFAGDGLVMASRGFSSGPRARLGDLRWEVERFAKDVAALPRSARAKP